MPDVSEFCSLCFFGVGKLQFPNSVLRYLRAFDGQGSSVQIDDRHIDKEYTLSFHPVDQALVQAWSNHPCWRESLLTQHDPAQLYCFSQKQFKAALKLSILMARSELERGRPRVTDEANSLRALPEPELSGSAWIGLRGLWRLELDQLPGDEFPEPEVLLKELSVYDAPRVCRFDYDPDDSLQRTAAAHFQNTLRPKLASSMPVLFEELPRMT